MAIASKDVVGSLTLEVLQALSHADPITSAEVFPHATFDSLKAALDRLSARSMLIYEHVEREEAFLEPEAETIVEYGSHEARVFEAVRRAMNGLSIQDLESEIGDKNVTKLGQGKAFKARWIRKAGDRLVHLVDSVSDVTRDQLREVRDKKTHRSDVLADLKKRKLIRIQKIISFRIRKGPKYALEIAKEETDLTPEMLASGSWKSAKFKPYNFNALGAVQPAGALHPLNKVRHEIRQIFFEMGFREMPTSQYVESGFWNFDALFVPQQHPARDLQDTFYVSDPEKADRPGSISSSDGANYGDYWKNVKAVHENGKFGSIGYRQPWSKNESLRLVLRTHTTAVSASTLFHLASEHRHGRFPPARYFSIDRVFRNESLDATHSCEFQQVEGVIADYGLSLGGLIGFMKVFFAKMGLTNLRFKPAYNPYTEPSMEIFSYHEGLGKLIEIGNSGMFRPEMLEAMGLPRDLRVYGFGLGLERPTMIKYGITNIRDLLGHQVDLGFIEKNPAVRLDRE